MGDFKEIIGQDNIKSRLKNSIERGSVSHAYIFEGEDGSGKKTLADVFSTALQCERGKAEPCLVCTSCKKARDKSHPDIISVLHEKPNSISVDEIRSQLVNDIQIKPYESRRKIYIIPEAEKMTASAQNALLKTLEEPPGYAVIILCTNNLSALLPTIISRCAVFRLYPLDNKVIKGYLMGKLQMDEYQAEIYAALARGNIGRAKSLIGNEDFIKAKDEAVRLARNAQNISMGRVSEIINLFSEDKTLVFSFLDVLSLIFRDALMLKAGPCADRVAFKEELYNLSHVAMDCSYEDLNGVFKAIDEARIRLSSNVSLEMSLELMLLKIASLCGRKEGAGMSQNAGA